MSKVDLETIIEDSIDDATSQEVTESSTNDDQVQDNTTDPTDGEVSPETNQEPVDANPDQTETPKEGDQVQKPQDDFDKRFNFPAKTADGRENRLPHSRVKALVTKAETEARKLAEEALKPKLTEFETKVKDYEGRLEKVAQFEQVMFNDPKEFLGMLSKVPAYKQFFDFVQQAYAAQVGIPFTSSGAAAKPAEEEMPQPDQKLPDGSMVYSMDGLKKLMEWQSKQVEQRVTSRYEPIEKEWQAHRQIQEVMPKIQQQAAEARTWPHFKENEDKIVEILNSDPGISLEGAYRKVLQEVVLPRMSTDRNKVRQEVLEEINKAPRSTSAPARQARTTSSESSGPRDLEDVIREQISKLK